MVNLEKNRDQKKFELYPVGAMKGRSGFLITKKRVLIGRSQTCDVVLKHNDITAIHAIIEVFENTGKIYDMNSTNGTYVNGKPVVATVVKIGDTIKFAGQEFEFRVYKEEDVAPPTLDMLATEVEEKSYRPSVPPKIEATTVESKKSGLVHNKPKLPVKKPEISSVPRVEYPLAKDPKAEFCEYIFEDVEVLYPIFNYNVKHTAVEVIILFKDTIYSVDYLPAVDTTYRLVGNNAGANEIEYAYLGKNEKVDFIETRNNEVLVHPLPGYSCLSLTDNSMEFNSKVPVYIQLDDILRFQNGDILIFVRNTQPPPVVQHAPIFRRDNDLKKYLLLFLLLSLFLLGGLSFIKVDKDIEKEKLPERIATILYRKKLLASKTNAIDKTEKFNKKIKQKSPQQKKRIEKVVKVKKKFNKVKSTNKNEKKAGDKRSKVTGIVKKATPNKGKVNNLKTKVVKPSSSKSKRPSRSAKGQPSKVRRAVNIKSPGRVDTYKSPEWKSTLNSLMAKGGSSKSVKAATGRRGSVGDSSLATGGSSATLKRAKVSNNVGNLSGAANGKLDSAKGVEGLVNKKSIFTAGVPYRTVVLGGMDPDVIRQILIDNISQFRYCYQKVLDKSESAYHGMVKLDFIIGASGHVSKAAVESTSGSLPTNVRSCVVNVLRGIKFPEPRGGGVVEVNQPFNFYPRRK